MVLGLLALNQGNVKPASQYLDAGSTPGSPQLNSFGPDMSLAQALLEKGERDTVLEYFCAAAHRRWAGTIWTPGLKRRAGGMPNMSMNVHVGAANP